MSFDFDLKTRVRFIEGAGCRDDIRVTIDEKSENCPAVLVISVCYAGDFPGETYFGQAWILLFKALGSLPIIHDIVNIAIVFDSILYKHLC